ncbi:MAG: hypothetical protein DI539_00395 [Flavobacterium psychrophilum]|nr:MAG: hypothetical protein DI539_00395 [Flavobacterium psychrophilum]
MVYGLPLTRQAYFLQKSFLPPREAIKKILSWLLGIFLFVPKPKTKNPKNRINLHFSAFYLINFYPVKT